MKTGIILLGSGYLMGVIGGVAALSVESAQARYGASCASGGAATFVPLIGPWIFAANYPKSQVVGYGTGGVQQLDCNSARGAVDAYVVVDELLQLSGAGLIAAGFVFRKRADAPAAVTTGKVTILPGASGAPLGMTVRMGL